MTYKVLLVDDDKKYSESLIDRVDEIEIIHKFNWEEAFSELNENFYNYDGVILDGKGQINKDSKTDDDSHVHKAINDLGILRSKEKYIPFVINTAHFERLKDSVNYDEIQIFDKSVQEEQMVACMLDLIKKSTLQKIKNEYNIAIDFAQMYFSKDNLSLLIDTLSNKNGDESNFLWKKEKLGNLRRLNEALVDSLVLNLFPPMTIDEIIGKVTRETGNTRINRGNRAVSFIEYFYKNTAVKVPKEIYNDIKGIYDTASKYSLHNPLDDDYYPSHFTVRGLIQAHIGCYEWMKKIIEA